MKSKDRRRVIDLALVLMFALAASLPASFWLRTLMAGQVTEVPPLYWAFFVMVTSIGALYHLKAMASLSSRYIWFILFLGMHLAVILSLGLPVTAYGFMVFVLLGVSLRFFQYLGEIEFSGDFALAILFLVLILVVQSRLGIQITPEEILLFFISGTGMLAILNTRKMEELGYPARYKSIALFILLFAAFTTVLSLLAGRVFSERFFAGLITLFRYGYWMISQAFLLLFRLFIWMLTPLLRLLEGYEVKLKVPDPVDLEGIGRIEEPVERVVTRNPLVIGPWVWWVLGICLVLALVYVILRILSQTGGLDSPEGYVEERESVFSLRDLRADLKNIFNLFKKPIETTRVGLGYGRSPVMQIRQIYGQFLARYDRATPYRKFYTPWAYLRKITRDGPEPDSLAQLTDLYNQARYREQVGPEQAEEARKVWGALRRKNR